MLDNIPWQPQASQSVPPSRVDEIDLASTIMSLPQHLKHASDSCSRVPVILACSCFYQGFKDIQSTKRLK